MFSFLSSLINHILYIHIADIRNILLLEVILIRNLDISFYLHSLLFLLFSLLL